MFDLKIRLRNKSTCDWLASGRTKTFYMVTTNPAGSSGPTTSPLPDVPANSEVLIEELTSVDNPTGTINVTESFSGGISAKTVAYNTMVGDHVEYVDVTGQACVIPNSPQVGKPYNGAIAGGGGAVTVTSGPLPDGLTMDGSGLITGTPTTAGVFPITVSDGSCSQDFTITVINS